MGFHTLLSVSHDSYDERDISWVAHLAAYVRTGDKAVAERIERTSGGAVQVVAMRHSADPYYISNTKPGFPSQLPLDEQLDVENAAWDRASTKARAWLGKTLKLRTMAEVRNLVIQLIQRHPVSDAQILAADGVFFARRKLENTQWQPSRADYEALKNRLMSIDAKLGESI